MPSSRLTLSKNTKTSQRVRFRKDGLASYYPDFPNSYGHTVGESCPGKTQFCEDYCYAVISEGRTNVQIAMRNNFDLLRNSNKSEMVELLREMIAEYKVEVTKKNIQPEENVFRIHWDGDFFSVEYAEAWAIVIQENPDINFWVYTRSFREPVNVVPILYGIPNLNFYLSVDDGNVDDAINVKEQYPKVRMAFCAEDQFQAEQLAKRAGKKHLFPCPENKGDIPLAVNGHGACMECKMCFKGRPNILFFNSPIYDTKAQQTLFEAPVSIRPTRRTEEVLAEEIGSTLVEELVLF